MTSVKAISSDEVFKDWLKDADKKQLEKFFKKKNVDFKRENISAVETVQNVSKFIVVYFEKNVQSATGTGKQTQGTQQITAADLEKTRFYNFGSKKVNLATWKGDKQVPFYNSLKEIKCPKCAGTGGIKCKSCGGTGTLKCTKCEKGKGKMTCKTCKNAKTEDYQVEVVDADGKKTTETKKVRCADCHGAGVYTCPDCGGLLKVPCKSCSASGTSTCDKCKGTGVLYEYTIGSVPGVKQKKSSDVYYTKDVEKFIDKKSVEDMLNSKDIKGIIITNPDDLTEKKLKPNLNYWTKDSKKICDDAKQAFKDYVKKGVVKQGTSIMVFPALQLDCTSVSGSKFEIFGIGVSENFVVLDSKFK
ncbi:MAG TPA: hypothetical protein VKM55_15815 [Candidatus Lokiarchaeia archaeon]|nr:hypothetical protein [Candidatus Lokiarchaeia archaeon]